MKNLYYILTFLLISLLMACAPENTEETADIDPVVMEKAKDLAQKYIITDGHVDLPYRM